MSSQDLQIDWLRAFLAVVDTGSMTAAARQVSRSQSAVSMQIRKLEDSVGRALLNRGAGSITLTPAGYDLLGHARRLMELHSATLAALHGGSVHGRITLGVPDDYVMSYLAPVLRTFASRFSEVELTLICEPSISLVAKVERGEIDLALATRDLPSRGEFLFQEELVWVGSDQHEVWKRNPLPIAIHGLDSRLRAKLFAALAEQQREYRVVYNSPNVMGQLAIADSGMAVAVITRCSLLPGLKLLDSRHGLPALPALDVVLLRSEQSSRSRAVDAMHEHVVRSLKEDG
jgi:DNA-binding transcriptional LysR family regulator